MGDAGSAGFTEQELRYVVLALDAHRGEANAMRRSVLLAGLGGHDRTLRAILAYLVKHPEDGVCPCHDFKGGIYAGATVREIMRTAEWYMANGVSSLEHASDLRKNAAWFAAAQPLLFELPA